MRPFKVELFVPLPILQPIVAGMELRQCRAARGLLGLTQAALARRASVGLGTVLAFEGGSGGTHASNVARIRSALEAGGVVFRSDGSLVTADAVLDADREPDRGAARGGRDRAQRCALSGGCRPEPLSAGAAQIVKAYPTALGEQEH